MGSFVYLIFAFIDCLAPPPVTSAEDSNDTASIDEADREYAAFDLTETKITFLADTVRKVLGDDTMGICKGVLGQRKRYIVFLLIFSILV